MVLAATCGCAAGTPPVTGSVPPVSRTPSPEFSPITGSPSPRDPAAAARAYVDAFNIAADTGDTAAYDRLVSPGCPCREPFLTSFVGALRAHHWHTDARRVVTKAAVVRQVGVGAIVDVSVRVDPYRVLDDANRTVRAGRPDRAVLRISLVRSGGRWLVADAVRR